MKHLLSITAVLVKFFVGCSNQENNITGPGTNSVNQLSKESKILTDLSSTRLISNLLPFQLTTITQVIDGTLGGTVSFVQKVMSSEGREVQVEACFKIPKLAFTGTKNITMTVNVDNGTISFFSHMIFNNTCLLDFRLSNMNLAHLGFVPQDTKAEFVFFNDEGGIETVQSLGVKLDYSTGYIKVQTVKINHFSRYGFVRKPF